MSGEWSTIDKSAWGAGPWQDEPDKIHWIDPETDLDCLMVRNGLGAWCGYVAVTEGHPAFEQDYDDVSVDVHGGLTYANHCQERGEAEPEKWVCHIPQPGRPDRVWWLGFDCCHAGDISPAMEHRDLALGLRTFSSLYPGSVYRDRAYVESEVRSLARQLMAVQ